MTTRIASAECVPQTFIRHGSSHACYETQEYCLTIATHSATTWREVRCECHQLLFIAKGFVEWIEVKCRRCHRINEVRGMTISSRLT